MAHIEKYKAHSVGHMLAHYRRDESSLGRDNIDRSRVGLDYQIGMVETAAGGSVCVKVKAVEGEPRWADVAARINRVDAAAVTAGKRRTRKDAVVLADFVVTIPEDVRPGDEERFFELTYSWLGDFVGRDNLLGGFVHRDEIRKDGSPVRDHMHVPFTPILNDRFNFKQLMPRARYQTMHKELGAYIDRRLGYHVSVALDEEERKQRVYADKTADIDAVRAAVAEQTAPLRRERDQLKRELETARGELETAKADLAEVASRAQLAVTLELSANEDKRDAEAARDAAVKERDAAVEERDAAVKDKRDAEAARDAAVKERDAAVEAVSGLETRVADLGDEVESLRADKTSLEGAVSRLREAYGVLRDEVAEFVEGVRAHVSALAAARRGSSSFWDALAEFIDNALVSKAFDAALGHMGAPGDNERILEDESERVLEREGERVSRLLDDWGDDWGDDGI